MEDKNFKSFEPKKENRFLVEFGNPLNIPEYVVKETTRPGFTKTNGGIKWNDMVFTMYDPISPSTSQAIMEGIRELRKQDSQTIEIAIKVLDPTGVAVEEWKIVGQINEIDFGTLSWENDEPLMINVYINVHHAILLY